MVARLSALYQERLGTGCERKYSVPPFSIWNDTPREQGFGAGFGGGVGTGLGAGGHVVSAVISRQG